MESSKRHKGRGLQTSHYTSSWCPAEPKGRFKLTLHVFAHLYNDTDCRRGLRASVELNKSTQTYDMSSGTLLALCSSLLCPLQGKSHISHCAESAKLCSHGKILKYCSCNVFSLAFCENCQHQLLSTVQLQQMTLTRPTRRLNETFVWREKVAGDLFITASSE